MAAESYALSETESQRIFDQEIVPTELDPITHHHHRDDGKQPLAVLIVGQTGAGKTRLAPVLRAAMAETGRAAPAHFIADTYKAYHPFYARLAAEKPSSFASAAAGPDARRWLAMACALAARRRVDVLVESACRHPDDFSVLAAAFRAAGFCVCVAVLAVPDALSRLGVLVRFYARLPEAHSGRMPLRLTPRRVHDDSYAGLADAARYIDAEDVADAVVVVRRGNLVAYAGRGGGAESALETERRRPLTGVELRVAEGDLEMLEGLGDPEVGSQVEEIRGLIARLGADRADGPEFPVLMPLDAIDFVGAGLS